MFAARTLQVYRRSKRVLVKARTRRPPTRTRTRTRTVQCTVQYSTVRRLRVRNVQHVACTRRTVTVQLSVTVCSLEAYQVSII